MDDYFKYNIIVMNQIGAWPLPNIRRKEILKQLYILFYMCLYSFETLSILWEVYDKRKDVFVMVEGIVQALLVIQSFIRMCSFLFRRNYIRELLSLLNDLYTITPIDNKDKFIMKSTEKWKKEAHLWVQLMVVSYIIPLVVSVMLPWIKYYREGVKTIFFQSKFQEDNMEWKYYILIDGAEVVAAWGCIVMNITGETFFATIIMYLCSRVDILKEAIKKSTKEAIEVNRTTAVFVDCVEYHKKLLRACEMLENFYSPMLFLLFLSSTLSICISSFLAMQKSSLEKALPFTLYLFGVLLELFVYCYFGELLQTKFENLEVTAAYEPWYNAPITYQKDLKFLLTRCMKPVTLTAYKISLVNMESFSSICKASASYYTILRSFTEDD